MSSCELQFSFSNRLFVVLPRIVCCARQLVRLWQLLCWQLLHSERECVHALLSRKLRCLRRLSIVHSLCRWLDPTSSRPICVCAVQRRHIQQEHNVLRSMCSGQVSSAKRIASLLKLQSRQACVGQCSYPAFRDVPERDWRHVMQSVCPWTIRGGIRCYSLRCMPCWSRCPELRCNNLFILPARSASLRTLE